jgi:hypothetical protein
MYVRSMPNRLRADNNGENSSGLSQASHTAYRHSADANRLTVDMQLSTADSEALKELADEAVSKFESDAAAVAWFEKEVRTRHPALWKSIRKFSRRSS